MKTTNRTLVNQTKTTLLTSTSGKCHT